MLRKRESKPSFTGKSGQARGEGVVVLLGQDGGGHEDRGLVAGHHGLEGPAQGHFGLAKAHVPAEQAVHGLLALQVLLDVLNGLELVLGLVEGEGLLELGLPLAVPAHARRRSQFPAGVNLEQLLGQLSHRALDPFLGSLPGSAAQLVEARVLLAP